MKLGIDKTAMIRVRAGISYALTEAMDEGHCGLPTDELLPLARPAAVIGALRDGDPRMDEVYALAVRDPAQRFCSAIVKRCHPA
jgi:hypothetical protein